MSGEALKVRRRRLPPLHKLRFPPRTRGKAVVLVKRKGMDVNFTCKEKTVYKNRTSKITDKRGVYSNIESYTVVVQVEDLVTY